MALHPGILDASVIVGDSAADLAISAAAGDVTYGELGLRSEHLARSLRASGVRSGDLVGLCVERSAALAVGALGILRAGGAYVAIDPAYPDHRIRWMLADAAVTAVVTGRAHAARLADHDVGSRAVLEPGGELAAGPPGDPGGPLPGPAGPRDPAYVVYTSGSTGLPKGVLVEHRSLANLVAWHRSRFALTAADRCTLVASPGFDASVWELWPALVAGASLHVLPESIRRDPPALRDWLVAEAITVCFLPTAIAETILDLSWPPGTALRCLLTGGDALLRRPASHLPFAVVNNYGLSETAVVATSGVVASGGDGVPSIGSPIDGVLAEVVDEQGNRVEPGVAGELLLGGVALARGYLNQPQLTAERFFENERGRWYRTGDQVRRRVDEELDFLGRLDDQLSLRGFRVEPAEIAAALGEHPAIAGAAVIGVGDSGAERQLVAYVVAAHGEQVDDRMLSEFAGERLPEYMVPARYVWLDELPLTANGKLDQTALNTPSATAGAAPAPDVTAGDDIGATIAGIVARLLGVEAVAADENFFLLGGHSMLGAQLIVRLDDLFGVEIGLRYLFDHPTPGEIAGEVQRLQRASPTSNAASA